MKSDLQEIFFFYRKWETFCLVKQKSVKTTGRTPPRALRREGEGLFSATQTWGKKHKSERPKYNWYSKYSNYIQLDFLTFSVSEIQSSLIEKIVVCVRSF